MNREDLNFYLQQTEPEQIIKLSTKIQAQHNVETLQRPVAQTLLLPVNDPVNHGKFYGGEILVVSVIVRVNQCEGWAMTMDTEQDTVFHMAVLDGAWASGIEQRAIAELVRSGKNNHHNRCCKEAAEVNATRVNFDLM